MNPFVHQTLNALAAPRETLFLVACDHTQCETSAILHRGFLPPLCTHPLQILFDRRNIRSKGSSLFVETLRVVE